MPVRIVVISAPNMNAFIAPVCTFARSVALSAKSPRTPRLPLSKTSFACLTMLSSAATLFPSHVLASDDSQDRGASSASAPAMSLKDLPALKDIEGNAINPETFSGKVVFAMNVASACGYTNSGYSLLARLTEKYSPNDFVAVAIPCNSFGWQESGSPDEIKTFALARAEKLVITERSEVNGNDAHPIVQIGKSMFPGRVSWNFDGRYVFNRSGNPVARFGNSASAEEIEAAIDKAL